MIFFKIICCLLLPVLSIAQVNPLFIEPTKKQADSLRLELKGEINDTLRMAAYRELALFYLDFDLDSALYFIEKDLPLAKKLSLKLWEADAHDLMGLITANQGNYVQALKSYNAAFQIAENSDCEKGIWNISKFTDSKKPEFARLSMLALIQSDVAGLYNSTENFDRQLKTIQDCIKTASRINDKTVLSQAMRGMGNIFLRQKQLDSALASFKKSLDYSHQVGYSKYRGSSYMNIGNIYMEKKLPELALENYFIALQLSIEVNNYAELGVANMGIANYYNSIGKNDSALYYAKAGLAVFQDKGFVPRTIMAYSTMATIYKSQNKFDSALTYMEFATAAKDSLLSLEKIKQLQNVGFDEQLRLQELEKERIETQSKIRTYGMLAGLAILSIFGFVLYRSNLQKQKANRVLETTLSNLKSTQSQLIQSEKMASLGELTAGIAHEIQNPLNFVNNFSEVNKELIDELSNELDKGNIQEVREIAKDLKENESKINHHGKRADAIVKSMLQHSKSGSGEKELTNINTLAKEYLNLVFQSFKSKNKDFSGITQTDFDESLPKIHLVQKDIGRVLLNLINNALYAVTEVPNPIVTLSTKSMGNAVQVSVSDNGTGIPDAIKDKIFQPFFTTKPTGQGTGLGLSLSYDIVKAHGGVLKFETKDGNGSIFIIQIPINTNNG